ncbi:MAG TPA: helix-turn-helix domain-containing protein [Methylomirabilota bacterium]|nr:helix-turn-helix domain-containing protein [Methylomirabilota bacterium]
MNTPSGWLAIGALSKRTGCKVETIRFYERARLLPTPARSTGGYRLYSNDHLKRLTFIRRARALGFSVDEVRKLLKLADERKRPCAEVRVVAGAHLEEVQAKIADLRAMERVLRETVAKCTDGRRADCPLIEALYQEMPSQVSPQTDASARRRKTFKAN